MAAKDIVRRVSRYAGRACLAVLAFGVLTGSRVAGQPVQGPAKLAILSDQAATEPAGELLTVEFSREKGLALLERSQIARIFREQQLSAANQDYLKLGQVLGADGLLVLSATGEVSNQVVTARLVAVKPGVVIGQARVPWPKGQEAASAKSVLGQFRPLLPKLTVLARDALPISVLNLRSVTRTIGDQSLERELTLLLIHRLTSEREVFVLERQHLAQALFEKQLKPEEETGFWTGSYLLDGTFDRDGSDPNRISLKTRLTPPRGGAAEAIPATGSRTNLGALVESLVSGILSALRKSPDKTEWQPLAEAEQFFTEGQWALRWGLRPEAQAASESAWALGLRNKDVAMLRIRSYLGLQGTAFWENGSTWISETPPLPDPSRFGPVTRSLEYFREDYSRFAGEGTNTQWDWLGAGYEAIDEATALLNNYYVLVETRKGVEEQLAELRNEIRLAAGLIATDFTLQYYYGPRRPRDYLAHWWGYQWTWGSLWHEEPEAALVRFRLLAEQDWFPAAPPTLLPWSWEARRRTSILMKSFVADLVKSTNDSVRFKGMQMALAIEPAAPVGDIRARAQEMADQLWAKRDLLYSGKLDAEVTGHFEGLVRRRLERPPGTGGPVAAGTEYLLPLRKDYLANAPAYDRQVFLGLFPRSYGIAHSEEEARDLPPLFVAFQKRLNLRPPEDRYVSESTNIYQFRGAGAVAAVKAKPTDSKGTVAIDDPYIASPVNLDLQEMKDWEFPLRMTAQFQQGKLWFLANSGFDNPGYKKNVAFIGMDLAGGRPEMITVPAENGKTANSFVITADSLFTTIPNRMLRYRLKARQWETTEIPVPDNDTKLVTSGSRIYIATSDGILEYEPESRKVLTLASARRRPPENVLERQGLPEIYGNMSGIFAMGKDRVGLIAQEHLFRHAPGATDWEEQAVMRFSAKGLSYRSYAMAAGDSMLLEITGNLVRARLLELNPQSGMLQPLLEHRFSADRRDPGADRSLPWLQWDWPKTEGLHGSFQLADKGSLWVLAPREWWQNGRDATLVSLFRFEPGLREPMRIPLRILQRAGGAAWQIGAGGPAEKRALSFLATPAGLVIVGASPGYWLLPQAMLDERLEKQRPALRAKAAARKEWRDALTVKFDANKNGKLDPDELASMHLDRECLEYDQNDIDRDENGFLDIDEIRYFDVNNDGVIDQKEYEGIRLFDRVLARAALTRYDGDRDGKLNGEEFRAFAGVLNTSLYSQALRKDPDKTGVLSGILDPFDRDQSDSLDETELAEFMDARFRALDWAAYDYKIPGLTTGEAKAGR